MKASSSQTRSSNFELLRILMILGIIAHHYVVNSGITENYDMTFLSKTMFFLQCFGFSGKAMINGFLLLTGYFMCLQTLTFQKILRLFAETICAFLDLLRQQFLEKPFLHWAAKTRIFKICSHFFDRIQDVPDQIAS